MIQPLEPWRRPDPDIMDSIIGWLVILISILSATVVFFLIW